MYIIVDHNHCDSRKVNTCHTFPGGVRKTITGYFFINTVYILAKGIVMLCILTSNI